MIKVYFLALTYLSLSLINYGQAKDVYEFKFDRENKTYSTKDTVRITYDLDSLAILYSNFGGCGGGAVYSIICHTDSLLTRGSSPECDHILVEYSYSKEGIVEFVIDSPGIYSVMFFVKNQDHTVIEELQFNQTLSTPTFEIIAI